jgi:hypothetical protein
MPSAVSIHFAIDNDVAIYLTGAMVASVTHDGCANYDDFNFSVPDGVLHPGQNLLVALCVDTVLPGLTRFDVKLVADGLTPALRTSWGQLKTLYR